MSLHSLHAKLWSKVLWFSDALKEVLQLAMTVATRHYSCTCSTMQESSMSTPHVLSLLSVLVTILHFHSWIKLYSAMECCQIQASNCTLVDLRPRDQVGVISIVALDHSLQGLRALWISSLLNFRHVLTFDQARRCIFSSDLSTFWLPHHAT